MKRSPPPDPEIELNKVRNERELYMVVLYAVSMGAAWLVSSRRAPAVGV